MSVSQSSEPLLHEDEKDLSQLEVIRSKPLPRKRIVSIIAAFTAVLLLVVLSVSQIGKSVVPEQHGDDGQAEQSLKSRASTQYLLGVGKGDITGPVVELNFMGYASLPQIGTGLRQRIYSRAFLVGDVSNPASRFVYLVLDTASGDTAIRYGILEGLANLGPAYSMYNSQNIAVTGTHSHSGPGAWMNYLLPQITSLGFDKQSYQAIVDGAVLSIKRAHDSAAPGYLTFGSTTVQDANLNRSPWSYLANPAAERALYASDVDKELTMLKMQRASDGKNIGVLTWFPVHGTSMLENNTHVTGDNKGVSAYLFEKYALTDANAAPGFVAGFSQANVGDTTPNTEGAWCDDGSSQMCTFENSTCAGITQTCHGRGPGWTKVDLGVTSCYEIGRRQFAGAKSLYTSLSTAATAITEPSVKAFHFYHDMQFFKFPLANGTVVQTCPAALGFSFAAGTTDGPGAFDFTQGDSGAPDNPLWTAVSGLLRVPTAAQVACQVPKPILLDTGEMSAPYQWSPNIVDIQVLRVGQLIIIVSPGEATTMSGRRWKAAVKKAAIAKAITTSDPIVVLGGPANTYTHYIATEEEYGRQRYEGASTLYGPHTLNAYINLTTNAIGYLAASSTTAPPSGPAAPNFSNSSLSFITGVAWDSPPFFKSFGEVITNPSASYVPGAVINATFVAANPRNNLRLEGTFAAVEKLSGSTWTQVRDDFDWSLVFTWTRDDGLIGSSHVVISWESETTADKGTYRIKYYGDAKALGGALTPFVGTSGNFTLV